MAERTISVGGGRVRGNHEIRIPADHEPHACTIMAWAVHREWGAEKEQVERELDGVIRAIAEYEPIKLLTTPDLVPAARGRKFGPEVEIVPAPVDDIWMRDIAPVFAKRGAETIAIDFNFNAWDNSRGSRAGDRLARTHDFGVPVIGMPFVAEGGAFITDGQGIAVTTRSCLLSRNPHLDEAAITGAFDSVGIRDVIWLYGDRTEPITTGHPDGFMAFLPDGKLLVENVASGPGSWRRKRDVGMLRQLSTEGKLNGIEAFEVVPDGSVGSATMAATYMNLFVTGGAVLASRFGETQNDLRAKLELERHFPGRAVRMLDLRTILNGGGGIRCLTQPVPV
ncbi:agmatine deiminase [Bradyrhizobium sp. USDA 4341]